MIRKAAKEKKEEKNAKRNRQYVTAADAAASFDAAAMDVVDYAPPAARNQGI